MKPLYMTIYTAAMAAVAAGATFNVREEDGGTGPAKWLFFGRVGDSVR